MTFPFECKTLNRMMSFRTASAVRNLLSAGGATKLEFHALAPVRGQVFPRRIIFADPSDFLLPPPGFDLRLARNCVADMFESLKPYQPVHAILGCEESAAPGLVPKHARHQCPGHADIEYTALARQHVNVIVALAGHVPLVGFVLDLRSDKHHTLPAVCLWKVYRRRRRTAGSSLTRIAFGIRFASE